MGGVVEINEIAHADIDRTDTEAHFAGLDAIEVDKTLERGLELRAPRIRGRLLILTR